MPPASTEHHTCILVFSRRMQVSSNVYYYMYINSKSFYHRKEEQPYNCFKSQNKYTHSQLVVSVRVVVVLSVREFCSWRPVESQNLTTLKLQTCGRCSVLDHTNVRSGNIGHEMRIHRLRDCRRYHADIGEQTHRS